MISRNTIDKVFETARVEEVLGDFVQLKKSGSNYKGLSPFTEERSPSFMVSPAKQIWKDFSSGKGGNVVAFLMEHEHFTYPEAIRWLAKKYNIEIEETEQTNEEKQSANERESLYLINEYANVFFQKSLLETEEGKAVGLSYFKERGFTIETIKKFQLGYSPDSWDAFTTEAIKKGYLPEFLEKTGLTIIKEDTSTSSAQQKKFDRFKGRVMFPIFSMSGRTLGFGGRILINDKKAAKYLNSPESEVYHKSKVLYGLFQSKQAIAKEDNCYLVEGYTDVIQLFQAGIHNVVSSSGTALTSDQIRLISRLTKNITLLFDGDAAGLRAAIRGVDLILEQGVNVKICAFPEGEDPDSFAKKTSLEELTLYLQETAQDFINFKASLLVKESNNDPVKKADTIRDMVSSISKIPDVIKREIYIQECSRIMDISENVLFNALAQAVSKNKKDTSRTETQAEKPFKVVLGQSQPVEKIDVKLELELKIIEILLLYGNENSVFNESFLQKNKSGEIEEVVEKREMKIYEKVFLDLQEDEIDFSTPVFQELYKDIIENYQTGSSFEDEAFIARLENEKAKIITDVFMENEKYQLHDWERKNIYVKEKKKNVAQLLEQTLLSLRMLLIKNNIDVLFNDIKQENSNKENILTAINDYNHLENKFARKLDTVVRRF